MEENEVVQPEVEQELEPEEIQEEPEVEEESYDELTELHAKLDKEAEARRQLTARATKAEADKKTLEARLQKLAQKSEKEGDSSSLDVSEYIDISASLEGLDQREKEKLAKEHKLTGQPLTELRQSEDFTLWQKAYRDKVEKEKALKPSSTQAETPKPQTLVEKLRGKSPEEKEKLLAEHGLWKSPKPRSNVIKLSNNQF